MFIACLTKRRHFLLQCIALCCECRFLLYQDFLVPFQNGIGLGQGINLRLLGFMFRKGYFKFFLNLMQLQQEQFNPTSKPSLTFYSKLA